MSREATTPVRRGRGRKALAIVALGAAALFVGAYRQVLWITQRPSWPPPPDAVTGANARAATEAFAAADG